MAYCCDKSTALAGSFFAHHSCACQDKWLTEYREKALGRQSAYESHNKSYDKACDALDKFETGSVICHPFFEQRPKFSIKGSKKSVRSVFKSLAQKAKKIIRPDQGFRYKPEERAQITFYTLFDQKTIAVGDFEYAGFPSPGAVSVTTCETSTAVNSSPPSYRLNESFALPASRSTSTSQEMALQAAPAPVSTSLSTDGYPTTPQQNHYYTSSQQSSGATARQQAYPNMSQDPNARSSASQPRSQSLALAPEPQLVDRTRQGGNSPGARSNPSRVAPAAQSSSTTNNTPAASSRPTDMSRENSEVIAKTVFDDPRVDLKREQARAAEAFPEVPQAQSGRHGTVSMPPAAVAPDSAAKPMKRQDFSASKQRKEARLGDYILGQTLGEGEFGKVKLGWKKDGSVQVAVKLIRRENLSTNPSRLPKIYREISILGQLSHPNIVKLHEMVETDRYIGIILEYASGGELFDYILTHRYLKDNAARRLFAQLVSGVGYLHKKGIVHRDLKLENLLLDRNRNLMITDFGFANTFDPRDELGEEIENRITDKDFVQRHDLERVVKGFRRGDLMQTSCGSPCYAAPELVVSDSLYTGRKVDVWSCGVILYAMLAGYLPFDDDPANPEGDNINLLYKYICNTPLTFPEYVSPHARDLLRRILVPDPRKRADLFEVARHSWLAEYAHVVEHITKMTTTIEDISPPQPVAVDPSQAPPLERSASVREPGKPPVAARSPALKTIESDKGSSPGDTKRRTVQVEYVAPRTQTTRGEASPPAPQTIGIPSTIPAGQTLPQLGKVRSNMSDKNKPLPQDPSGKKGGNAMDVSTPTGGKFDASDLARPIPPRRVSESANAIVQAPPVRPTTGGSMSSSSAGRLPSRGNSYSQVLAPTVAATSASGRIAQPKSRQQYPIPNPTPTPPQPLMPDDTQRPTSQRMPSVRKSHQPGQSMDSTGRGHKRSTTLSSLLIKTNSLFGGSKSQPAPEVPKTEKRYPPTSMRAPMPTADDLRLSSDSRRRPSLGPSRTSSGTDGSVTKQETKPKRMSLLSGLKGFTSSNKESSNTYTENNNSRHQFERQPQRGATAIGHPSDSVESMTYSNDPRQGYPMPPRTAPQQDYNGAAVRQGSGSFNSYQNGPMATGSRTQQDLYQPQGSYGAADNQLHIPQSATAPQLNQYVSHNQQAGNRYQPSQPGSVYDEGRQMGGQISATPTQRSGGSAGIGAGSGRSMLQRNNRKFEEGYQDHGQHAGSTSAARKVMDFFRRRGKDRVEVQGN